MKLRSSFSTMAVVAAIVLGSGVPAYANAGTFTQQDYQIVFFYDVSAGNAYSFERAGRGSERLSVDAPGSTLPQTVTGELYRKSFWSQSRIVSVTARYSDPVRFSSSQSLSSSNTYATRAVWNFSGDQPGMPNGFSRRG